MKRILFALAILLSFGVQAQPVELKLDPCQLWNYNIPDTLGYTPLKQVRLVLHIFAKADSSGNFRNTKEDRDFIGMVFNHMNWHYKETEPLRNPAPGYYHIVDSRIRLVVDTILFHYDNDAWNFKKYTTYYEKKTGDSTGYNLMRARNRCDELHGKYVAGNTDLSPRQRDSALHIFFLEVDKHPDKGMAENFNSKKWAYFTGAYHHYKTDKAHWTSGMLMAHEIGHSLGLYHPFDFSGCEDLPMTEKGATNNLMDTHPGEGRAMTPCQMGQIHRNLLGAAFGDIHHTLIQDWCSYHSEETMTVIAGDTVYWTTPHYLWGDLVIEEGAVLVVKCELSMPPGAEIRVRKNGALILDGGSITQKCGAMWKGVKLEKRKKLLGIFRQKSLAEFEMRNGARIERAEEEAEQSNF